jgi:tetratricopeptide (TPR) repeat protein
VVRRAKVSVSSSPLRSGRLLASGIAGLGLLLVWLSGPVLGQESLEDYELNYSRGAVEFDRGRYESAGAFFRSALLAKPDDPEASAYLGQTLLRRKQYGEAEAVFQRMLTVNPSSGPAWLGLGILQYHQTRYQEAKESLLSAEKESPEDPLVHYYLGLTHHELGEFEEAPSRFRRAMTLSPDLAPSAQYYSGVAHLRRGAPAEAREALEAAIAAEPESEQARSAKEFLAQLEAPPSPESWWKVNGAAGMEYDTNVVLLPGGTSPPAGTTGISQESDYRSVLAGSLDFRGLQTDRLTGGLTYGIYQSFHSRLSGFDVEDHAPSAYLRYQDGPVSLNLQYIYNYTLVGRSPYLNANTALTVLTLTESANTATQLQFRYMDKVFRSGRFLLNQARNGKNWLAGVTQYLAFSENKGRVWLGYLFDTDVTGGGSPTVAAAPNTPDNADWNYQGHHVSTGLEMPPILTLELSLAFDWIHQQYANPNSYSVDGRTRRRDNVYSFTGAVSRDFGEHLSLTFQYTYNRDDTNVDVFTYTRSIYSLMLSASF